MTFRLLSLMLTLAFSSFAAAQQVVGKVSFSKGSNAAQQQNAAPRLLGKDAEIYQGDNIQTSDASFVIVEFIDGSKVTIRPNSNFKIEQFDAASKNAKLTVYEGGVRASTGEIAKAGSDNFQIKTPTTTLKGAKDSDYSVRVCNDDCDDKNKTESKKEKDTSIAKIVDIKGDVFAENKAEKNAAERKLAIGDSLEIRDYLTSQANSYAVMVFRDGEKVTLQANSEFDIVKYDFNQAGKKDQILFKLAAGGMRALTGHIGKKDHSAYAVNTPVATIGIRGTEYETSCIGDCGNAQNSTDGMYSHVTQGAISQNNSAGELVLEAGQNSFIANQSTPAIQIPNLPDHVLEQINNAPSPKIAPDADKIYSPEAQQNSKTEKGSYVTVNKGSGTLESDEPKSTENSKDAGNSMALSEGESSFSGNGATPPEKLDEPPPFIAQDKTPIPEFSSTLQSAPLFSPNDSNVEVDSAACVVE